MSQPQELHFEKNCPKIKNHIFPLRLPSMTLLLRQKPIELKRPLSPFWKLEMSMLLCVWFIHFQMGQSKLCHHPPPAKIYPPTPTTSQNISTITTTTHHQPKYVHHHPPLVKIYPLTCPTTHRQPKCIHHHQQQSKIYPSKKLFYKKNIKIFYSKVNDEKHFD